MTLVATRARGSMDSVVLPKAGAEGLVPKDSWNTTLEARLAREDEVPRTRGGAFPPAPAAGGSPFKAWYPASKRDSDASRPPPPAAAALRPIRPALATSGMDMEVLLRENDLLDRRNKLLEQEIAKAQQQVAEQRASMDQGARTRSESQGLIHELQANLHLAQSQVEEAQAECRASQQQVVLAKEERDAVLQQHRQLQQQLADQASRVDALQHSLGVVTGRYHQCVREAGQNTVREEELMEALEGRETDVELAKALLARSECQLAALTQDREQLQATCQLLESRNAKLEEQLLQSATGIQKDRQLRDEAELELKKATMREEGLQKEAKRLGARIESLSTQLRKDFETQLEGLRGAQMEEKRKYMQEINDLEMRCASLQVTLDRSTREKAAVETEAEGLRTRLTHESDRYLRSIHDLSGRIVGREREVGELAKQLETARHQAQAEASRWEVERQSLTRRHELAYQRTRRLEAEAGHAQETYSKLLQEHAALTQVHGELEEAKKRAATQAEARWHKLDEELRQEVREEREKLSHLQEQHDRLLKSHQVILADQRLLAEKWSAESQFMKQRYEGALQSLRDELATATAKVREVEERNQALSIQATQLLEQLQVDRSLSSRRELQLKEAERRLQELREREAQLTKRESDLAHDRKRMQLAAKKQAMLAAIHRQNAALTMRTKLGEGILGMEGNGEAGGSFGGDGDSGAFRPASPDKTQFLMAEIQRVTQRSRAQDYELRLRDLEAEEAESSTA